MTLIITPEQCAGYAQAAGFRGSALTTAVAVAGAESHYDVDNIGDQNLEDSTWGASYGLWQIRSLKAERETGKSRDEFALYPTGHDHADPAFNAKSAYEISSGGTNWTPWSTYNSGAYKQYLSRAEQAAANPSTAPGGSTSSGSTSSSTPSPTASLAAGTTPPPPDTGPALDVRIGGVPATTDLGYALLNADMSLTTEMASQLTLEFYDPDCLILSRYMLKIGAPDGTPVTCMGMRWRLFTLASRSAEDGARTVFTVQPSGVMRLRGWVPEPWSNRTPTDYVAFLASIAGLDFRGEETANVPAIGSEKMNDPVTGEQRDENAWEVAQRLAAEHGMVCYESMGELRFGTAVFLAKITPRWQISYRGLGYIDQDVYGTALTGHGWPTIEDTKLGQKITNQNANYRGRTFTGQILASSGGARIRAGDQVIPWGVHLLDGIPSMTVTSVSWKGNDPQAAVNIQAADQALFRSKYVVKADQAASAPVLGDPNLLNAGTKKASDFVNWCLSQRDPNAYQFGAEVPLTDNDPVHHGFKFDCSELTQWGAYQVGVYLPDGSSAQHDYCSSKGTLLDASTGAQIRGALMFHPGHVAVSLGDGVHTIEAMGEKYGILEGNIADRFSSAGKVPGMIY